MTLTVVNLSTVAARLERPFAPLTVAQVGELAVSVVVSQGQIQWHRHLDEDELFLVHEGLLEVETERGNISLNAEEAVLIPKGTAHRSGSALRAVVVLIRPAVLTTRPNGHRRLYALESDPPLEKVRLSRISPTLALPYQPVTLARVGDFDLLLLRAEGAGPEAAAPRSGAWWLVMRGTVELEMAGGAGARLEAGEMTLVPAGQSYRVRAAQGSLLLTLARG